MGNVILAFINAHFNAVMTSIAAESTLVATIYGFVTRDIVFASVLVFLTVLAAVGGIKFFAHHNPVAFASEV